MFTKVLYTLALLSVFVALVSGCSHFRGSKMTAKNYEVYTAGGGQIVKIETEGKLRKGDAVSFAIPKVADLRGITISSK